MSASFAHLLSEKDDTEVELCRKAAQASVNAWSYARKKIIDIIDQAKVILVFDIKKYYSFHLFGFAPGGCTVRYCRALSARHSFAFRP